jgi:hypothetical protein
LDLETLILGISAVAAAVVIAWMMLRKKKT